jgi:hypothetical protein
VLHGIGSTLDTRLQLGVELADDGQSGHRQPAEGIGRS